MSRGRGLSTVVAGRACQILRGGHGRGQPPATLRTFHGPGIGPEEHQFKATQTPPWRKRARNRRRDRMAKLSRRRNR